MIPTVKDVCQIHPMALNYAIVDQIENLSNVIEHTAEDARAFFAKNHITRGMDLLLRQGLKRLAGCSDQAVFELKQAMGGGKTHSMIALGLLARDAALRAEVVPDIAQDAPFADAKLVAINGRLKFEQRFIWGEIARQLGKEEAFVKFWQHGADAPGEQDWIDLIGDEPTLILLDELPPYFDYAITRMVGGGTLAQVTTYALSNLLSAALKLKRCCIVISNLSGSYEGASRELQKAIGNFAQETNRQARSITPVDLGTSEIYDILRKRLFSSLPSAQTVDAVASAYAKVLGDAARAKSIAKTAEQIAAEIHASYPFHPSVKHIIALFKENESHRQTRGLMQFVSKIIRSVWERPSNDVYLIGCQHLNLNIPDVREEINKISNLQGAIAHDIAANGTAVAELVDQKLGHDTASQIAALLLTASLSESVDAVKGFTEGQFLEYLVAPQRNVSEFQEAFQAFRANAWYLHRKENDAWYFSNIENLRKRIDSRARNAPQPKIDAEMKRRLEEIFRPQRRIAYQEVQALPKIDEIRLNGPRVCLVLSPDSKTPPEEAQQFWESVLEKNNFCVVTGDGSNLASLEDKTRRLWAVARVLEETGGDKSPHKAELEEEAEQAAYDFNATVVSLFNRVYYPTRGKLTSTKLSMTFTGNTFHAEEQIEKALSDVGASKLYVDVEANAEALLSRAEDLLWPAGGERRIPWRDVVSRTITNERWSWLPPKGMETLRQIAVSQGRWRYTEDGYIEKGPFPPPRTSVAITQRDYDDCTGTATLEILPRDAGKNGRVHYSYTPNVDANSPVVPDTIWTTDATALWFVAIDPDGQHETGDVYAWKNMLTLTHQPRIGGGKRTVELTVKPRGQIRWNITGINPREGNLYTGPIELEGSEAVTIREQKHFEIDIVSGVSEAEMKAAAKGTVQNGDLVYVLDGEEYRTPIKTIRGDYRLPDGTTGNKLRRWEKHDFMPRPDDIFQERLYCIQWITAETLGKSRQETFFASVTPADLEREGKVEQIVGENLAAWQEAGLVPDMPIEPGEKTDEPIRTRGWTYWHHLFNARQLLVNALYLENLICHKRASELALIFSKSLDWSGRLTKWDANDGCDKISNVFTNQALILTGEYEVLSTVKITRLVQIGIKTSLKYSPQAL